MPLVLIPLAVAAFGIGLTEFIIAGLLPDIARDFAVDAPTAGWLISGYALSVAVGALGITAMTMRFTRKKVLVALMIVFVIGNLLSAVAPGYGALLAGRIIAAASHGAFFGVAAVVAAGLVPAERKGRAVALLFSGLTVANVLGVPLGTVLGQQMGWRSAFWVITIVGIVALAGVWALVPSDHEVDAPGVLRDELRAFRSKQVWLSLVITVLGFGGMFGALTYIAFTLTEVSDFAASAVPWLLVVFGVGLVFGNYAGGRLAGRSIDGTLGWSLVGLVAALVVFALTAANPVVTVVSMLLVGAFGFGPLSVYMVRVIHYAGDAGTLASGATIAAGNVGNAIGPWLGGIAITAGFGYTAPLWTGAATTVLAVAVLVYAMATARRDLRPDAATTVAEPVSIKE